MKIFNVKSFALGFVITLTLTVGVVVLANETINVALNEIKVYRATPEGAEYIDKPNILYDGTTYVPLRFISELYDIPVNYVEETHSAYIGEGFDINEVKPVEQYAITNREWGDSLECILYYEGVGYQTYLEKLTALNIRMDGNKIYVVNKYGTSALKSINIEFINIKTGETFNMTFNGYGDSNIQAGSQSEKQDFNYDKNLYLNRIKYDYINSPTIKGTTEFKYDECVVIMNTVEGTSVYSFEDYIKANR